MDKIHVADVALNNVIHELRTLEATANQITTQCVQEISGQLNNIESGFRKDLQQFIDSVVGLNGQLIRNLEENVEALEERKSKIVLYEEQSYIKRNIG